jgi:hypothetical protein
MRLKSALPIALTALLLQGCATPQIADENVAIDDFIVVSELEPLKVARFRHQYSYKQLTESYVVLTARDDYYLVGFRRRCRELNMRPIEPDVRYERNTLRVGADTIRGCHINSIFAIDRAQAEELEHIGQGP